MLTSAAIADEPATGGLRERLAGEELSSLAKAVAEFGDARRGVASFHEATLACARCHSTDGEPRAIGPDLTQWSERPTTEQLGLANLEPSRFIRSGYETAVVPRVDGRQAIGLLERFSSSSSARRAESLVCGEPGEGSP